MVQHSASRDQLSRTAADEIVSLKQALDMKADVWPDHVKQACEHLIRLYCEFDELLRRSDATIDDVMELEAKVKQFHKQTRWKGDHLHLYLQDLAEIIRSDAA